MTSFRLALSNLRHDRGRAAVSILGAAFAVVLIFMQLGFYGATVNTATLLFDRLNFDVIVLSKEYTDLSSPGQFDRARLAQAAAAAGVEGVAPFSTAQGLWRNPTPRAEDPRRGGRPWAIVMLGADPADFGRVFLPADRGLFADPQGRADAQAKLARLGTVYLDRRASDTFGDQERLAPGLTTEYNGARVELAGKFELGRGFSFTGLLLANEETFAALNNRPPRRVTFGLVRLTRPDDAERVARELNRALPEDVKALTRDELFAKERYHWTSRTPVGKFFFFGVLIALLVGAIFVYQMMVADIKKRLPEYATLKAVGYPFGYLFRVVCWQAIFLALGGYGAGLAASLGLYELTRAAVALPIAMTPERVLTVFALTTAMCVGSGLVAVQKVKNADPADLF